MSSSYNYNNEAAEPFLYCAALLALALVLFLFRNSTGPAFDPDENAKQLEESARNRAKHHGD